MCSFDDELIKYCKEYGYKYSRYADDIYISSYKYIGKDVKEFVASELSKNNFKLNNKKTKFYSSKYRKIVTGLIITNERQVSIGTERRNEIKKMIYNKLVNGNGESEQILGYLAYLKDVEPNTFNKLIIKYSKYCTNDIIAEIKKK